MIAQYILVFFIGLFIGSVLNIWITREDNGEHIFNLRGKCLKIRLSKRLSKRHIAVIAVTVSMFVLLYFKYSLTADFIALSYLASLLIAVFFIDLKHRIIPDELVVAGLAGGVPVFIYNLFNPLKIYVDNSWWNPLLGMLPGTCFLFAVSVIGMLIYKSNDAIGMGDVKIFAPIGFFLGWRMCILSLVLSIFMAGFASMVLIIAGIKKRKDTIPFGPFIVAGTFIAITWGIDILKWYLA